MGEEGSKRRKLAIEAASELVAAAVPVPERALQPALSCRVSPHGTALVAIACWKPSSIGWRKKRSGRRGTVPRRDAIPLGMQLTIEVEREDDGRWTAEVAEIGALVTCDTRDEAIRAAKALALRVIADRLDHGEDVLTGQPGTGSDAPSDLRFSVAA